MYFILKNQSEMVNKAIKKAGSERKLAKNLNVVKSTVYYYKYKNRPFSETIFRSLIRFLNLNESDAKEIIYKRLDDNWKQRIGGVNAFRKKVNNGTFKSNLEKMNRMSSILMKNYHKNQKELNKENYYKRQYENFRKISEYKYFTKRGEKVRNALEKLVADFLFKNGIKYEYEPYFEGRHGVYFPDFVISNKIIIECTMWRNFDKSVKLQRKIRDYEISGYNAFVVIPHNLRRFYKRIENYIIDENELVKIKPSTMPL